VDIDAAKSPVYIGIHKPPEPFGFVALGQQTRAVDGISAQKLRVPAFENTT
jgi:hypothetical protein